MINSSFFYSVNTQFRAIMGRQINAFVRLLDTTIDHDSIDINAASSCAYIVTNYYIKYSAL